MTVLDTIREQCALCGKPSEHAVISSSNQFGPQDLDTRPAEMLRGTIEHWVRCCPSCGHCAASLSKAQPGAGDVVRSDVYAAQLRDAELVPLARRFLCSGLLAEAAGDLREAGFSALHAAWVSDDRKADDAARRCRAIAAARFLSLLDKGGFIIDEPGVDQALLSDVLRRLRRFDDAAAMARRGLERTNDENVLRVLGFEIVLAERRDDACHDVGEAQG